MLAVHAEEEHINAILRKIWKYRFTEDVIVLLDLFGRMNSKNVLKSQQIALNQEEVFAEAAKNHIFYLQTFSFNCFAFIYF